MTAQASPQAGVPRPTHARLAALGRFLAGGRFAAFALLVLAFYTVFIAVMVFAPPAGGAWAAYVEEFRVRCFQYDPATGAMARAKAALMLTEPLPLAALFWLLWRGPLGLLWRTERAVLLPLGAAALAVVAGIAVALTGFGGGRAEAAPAPLPFPADRLRSALPAPAFDFVNQDGAPVRLEDFSGRVVILTAVYASCTATCPMILSGVREVLDGLGPAEREDLAVVAFSLNPETDTRELRAAIAKTYGMAAPSFHFVNGDPAEVNALLDRLAVTRARDAKTGQIAHSNLFFLLDRGGRIAYRLSLSQREQSWLGDAVRVLLAEPAP